MDTDPFIAAVAEEKSAVIRVHHIGKAVVILMIIKYRSFFFCHDPISCL